MDSFIGGIAAGLALDMSCRLAILLGRAVENTQTLINAQSGAEKKDLVKELVKDVIDRMPLKKDQKSKLEDDVADLHTVSDQLRTVAKHVQLSAGGAGKTTRDLWEKSKEVMANQRKNAVVPSHIYILTGRLVVMACCADK